MSHESDKLLKSYVDQNKAPSALLFIGESMEDLAAHAQSFCIDLLERKGANSTQLEKVQKGIHPDVRALNPSSQMGVYTIEQLREICTESQLFPNEAPLQVFIFNHAERMGEAAANAFLKTLEEPNHKTIFILLAKSLEPLLPTLASRLQKVFFEESATVKSHEKVAMLESFLAKWPKVTYNDLHALCSEMQSDKEKDLNARIEEQRISEELLVLIQKWYLTLESPPLSQKRFDQVFETAKGGLERSMKLSHTLEYLLLQFITYD